MKLGIRRDFSEIGALGSKVMYACAVASLGLAIFLVSNGPQFFNLILRPSPSFSVGTWALLVLGGAYILAIFPWYGDNSMWVMGLVWGGIELTYNVQLLFIRRMGLPPTLDNPVWNAYILLVVVLFGLSLYSLRNVLKLDRRTGALILPIVLFLPAFNVLGSLGVLELPVYLNRAGSVGFDIVVVACVLLITRPALAKRLHTTPDIGKTALTGIPGSAKVAVIIPSLGRPSLSATREAVERDASSVWVLEGPRPVAQVRDLASSLANDLVAIVDDDALPPPGWLPKAASFFQDPKVAYACGPLIDPSGRYPQLVQESFLGSFVMRDRYKLSKTSAVSELHIHGMGVYRRQPFVRALQELGDVDMPAWENKVVTVLEAEGWMCIRSDELASAHPSRAKLGDFFRQKVKEGKGRGSYFRTFPRELAKKPFFLLPLAAIALLFVWPLNAFFLGVYITEAIGTCRSLRPLPWFFANHLGYSAGLVMGLIG